ncbi:thermonuclease family protein [Polaromonas sp. C04]|nr:thermonuclease family protein [Polaromonas sp. C04]
MVTPLIAAKARHKIRLTGIGAPKKKHNPSVSGQPSKDNLSTRVFGK